MEAKIWTKSILMNDNEEFKKTIKKILIASGFTILQEISCKNISLYVLAESHLAYYRFSGKIFLQLSSCVEKYYISFWSLFDKYFQGNLFIDNSFKVKIEEIWIATDKVPESIKKTVNTKLFEKNLFNVEFKDYNFFPQGYTAVWIFNKNKGYITLHTFPEEKKIYFQAVFYNSVTHFCFWDDFKKYVIDS